PNAMNDLSSIIFGIFLFNVDNHRRSPFFPYTTLLRSHFFNIVLITGRYRSRVMFPCTGITSLFSQMISIRYTYTSALAFCSLYRSEEHTSELQSREKIVCRLLLEKKK